MHGALQRCPRALAPSRPHSSRCQRPVVIRGVIRGRLRVAAEKRDVSADALSNQVGSVDGTVDLLRSVVVQTGVEQRKDASFKDANFPIDAEGRTLHLGTKRGEVANRVLSVGSMDRALMVAGMLDPPRPGAPLFQHLSGRGFLTVTGRFQGTPVSVVTTLMGMANMDFVVRECRSAADGQMAVVRLGTCGALRPPAKLGDLLVAAEGAVCVRRDPDAWTLNDGRPRYAASAPVKPDALLTALLAAACEREVGPDRVVCGLDATADSFYGSQGRTGGPFDDGNESLIDELLAARPELISLEMETFQLLHLAACSGGSVVGAAFCIALAERYSNRFLDGPTVHERELQGGRAALAALVGMPLQDDASTLNGGSPHARPSGGYVWEAGYDEAGGGGGAAQVLEGIRRAEQALADGRR
ncbi:MAG: nucleoside phosphorylase domain-containing protein [Monoraphidium minutum]|nr:MAG: nucleoside phosphorylase domain-containing protein [Monoraphidium minutum]